MTEPEKGWFECWLDKGYLTAIAIMFGVVAGVMGGLVEDVLGWIFVGNRDQPPASAADDAQLGHHVLFEEVDADTEGVSRLAPREREPT